MGLSRPVAGDFYTTSTGTGVIGTAQFGTGMSAASAISYSTLTTQNVAFQMQAAIGDSTKWFNLNAAATTASTAAAGTLTNSTVAMTFDKIRINVTANASTGNGRLDVHVLAR